jgi:hypothetical protein
MYSPNGGIAIRDVHVILRARYNQVVSVQKLNGATNLGNCWPTIACTIFVEHHIEKGESLN